MELKTKILKWSAGVPVAMLNLKTAEKLGVHSKDRIEIRTLSKNPKVLSTVVDTIKGMVNEREIAISSELKDILELKNTEKTDERKGEGKIKFCILPGCLLSASFAALTVCCTVNVCVG